MGSQHSTDANFKDLKRRATVILRQDEQILFVRKRNAKWNLPGGRVEQGETPLQAALREMAEETGLAIDQISYVCEYEDDKVIHFLFEARRTFNQKPRAQEEAASKISRIVQLISQVLRIHYVRPYTRSTTDINLQRK